MRMKRVREKSYLSNFLGWPTKVVIITYLLLIILFPFYWLVSNSIKEEQEYFSQPPILVPSKATMENFVDIFTKRQVAGRLRQLKALYAEWLLTDDFYLRKVAECEASL